MTMESSTPQVLIVGGGIVGLSTSLFLSQQGLTSLLVERRPNTSMHPRSRSVNSRTMELYRSLGIDGAVRAAGASLAPSKGIYRGTSLVDVIGPHKRSEENYARLMKISGMLMAILGPVDRARGTQDCVEPVLLEAARERGGDVRFGVECVGFEQDGDGVSATLRERETSIETVVRVQYLIAADGAGSPIRKTLGVKSSGAGRFGYLLNVLFHADLTNFVKGRNFSLCQIERTEVRGLFTSINNSDRWVFHLSYDPSKGQTPDDFPPEKCEQLIRIALGMPDVEIAIKSILPWEPSVYYVEQMQHGRVFLAGDAAHVMPPWGGQGANSGIADVHNLAWKLAAVIKGQASSRILATYDAERLPVDRLAADESGRQCDEVGLIDMKRTLKAVVELMRRVPRVLGYGYKYASKAIVVEDEMPWYWKIRWISQFVGCAFRLCGEAGTRVPHISIQHEGEMISTLDLSGVNFVLLAGRDGDAWVKAAPKVASMLGVELEAYRIGPTSELVCRKGLWESRAGISTRGALLVRPDGFVAWRSWAQPVELCGRLEKVMLKALCRQAVSV